MRKYLRFVSQSVLGMLGLSVYILADTFFIANFIGADGLASLNLALPIYGIINGTGLLIGIGGGVRYTLRHTRGDENADSVFTASLLMGAVLSFIYVLCGVFGAEHLARLLGASGTVLQPTTVYLKVCCLFSPFFILNNILTAFTRNDDAPGRGPARASAAARASAEPVRYWSTARISPPASWRWAIWRARRSRR